MYSREIDSDLCFASLVSLNPKSMYLEVEASCFDGFDVV